MNLMSVFNKMKSILFFIFLLSQINLISSTDCPEGQIFDDSQNSCTDFVPESICNEVSLCKSEDDETCIEGKCACKSNRYLNAKKTRCLPPLLSVIMCKNCEEHENTSCNINNKCVCEDSAYKYSLDKNEIECFLVIPEKFCLDDEPCKEISELSLCDTTKQRCYCVDGYTYNSRENKCLPILTKTTCVSDDDCSKIQENSVCDSSTKTCTCKANTYINKYETECFYLKDYICDRNLEVDECSKFDQYSVLVCIITINVLVILIII